MSWSPPLQTQGLKARERLPLTATALKAPKKPSALNFKPLHPYTPYALNFGV